MPKVPLSELKKTYQVLCDELETGNTSSLFTSAQVEAMKASLGQEIAELEGNTKAKGQSG